MPWSQKNFIKYFKDNCCTTLEKLEYLSFITLQLEAAQILLDANIANFPNPVKILRKLLENLILC